MKVYVVEVGVSYEGETLIGVFTDLEAAKNALRSNAPGWSDYYGMINEVDTDSGEIDEFGRFNQKRKLVVDWNAIYGDDKWIWGEE